MRKPLRGTTPVSYTHLDVYKRQTLNSQYRSITETEVIALNMAMMGATFGEVCASLEVEMNEEEAMTTAAQYLAGWLENGLICKVVLIKFAA